MPVQTKRVYDPPTAADGFRVLVDRIWPRGIGKNELVFDAWEKEVAPNAPLRKWFAYEPARWPEFQRRYREELAAEPAAPIVDGLVDRARQGMLTLLFAGPDRERNGAAVLLQVLEERLS
ncbi:MAG TPA: DUF488 family protein [Tepidiformaceae bacterium]|jgi:uncharacterized protein YeaO (DUF488 family)